MASPTWTDEMAARWGAFPPPIRPYGEEVALMKQLVEQRMQEVDGVRLLVLGSTPELRDLAADLGLVPTVVDYSRQHYDALTKLMVRQGTPENFIQSNWLEFHATEKYDIVLSEAAFNVVDRQDSDALYQQCFNWLKPDGLLLAKTWVRPPGVSQPLENLLVDFRNTEEEAFGFYSHACIPLILCFYNYEDESILLSDFAAGCERAYASDLIGRSEWMSIAMHSYESSNLRLYIPQEHALLSSLDPLFRLDQVMTIEAANARYHPIYVLTRR